MYIFSFFFSFFSPSNMRKCNGTLPSSKYCRNINIFIYIFIECNTAILKPLVLNILPNEKKKKRELKFTTRKKKL